MMGPPVDNYSRHNMIFYNIKFIEPNSYSLGMDTFSAVADPRRRAMLDLLVKHERSAGELVSAFPDISQPAVSKHLRILKDAGLVDMRVHAQQRIYTLQPKGLAELDAWIAKYKVFWSEKLDSLERHLDKNKGAKRK
jgi:DNA-binding transcriptional ArsR family regulator